MYREEAITYLKELLSKCTAMSPNVISFEKNNSDAVGYRVHITGDIAQSEKMVVQDVAKKYNLSVKDNGEGVIVYKPK